MRVRPATCSVRYFKLECSAGTIDGSLVQITGRKALLEQNDFDASLLPVAEPGMECILLLDGRYKAAFRLHDTPRQESLSFVRYLGRIIIR